MAAATPCPVCGGTGWKPAEQAEGRTATVTRCDCQAAASAEEKLRTARIPPRYTHCEFSNFGFAQTNPQYEQSLQEAKLRAETFAREYPQLDINEQGRGLIFMGPVGVGKTHLAVATLQVLLDRGFDGVFCDFRDLLKQIQDSYNPVSQTTEMGVLTPVLQTEILVLDDLGATKPTDWVRDTVGHILNTRYNEKRTTLITTNYLDRPAAPTGRLRQEDSLSDRIGERMVSRVHEMCRLVEIWSEDFRRTEKSR